VAKTKVSAARRGLKTASAAAEALIARKVFSSRRVIGAAGLRIRPGDTVALLGAVHFCLFTHSICVDSPAEIGAAIQSAKMNPVHNISMRCWTRNRKPQVVLVFTSPDRLVSTLHIPFFDEKPGLTISVSQR
jgi:hypothetical protein